MWLLCPKPASQIKAAAADSLRECWSWNVTKHHFRKVDMVLRLRLWWPSIPVTSVLSGFCCHYMGQWELDKMQGRALESQEQFDHLDLPKPHSSWPNVFMGVPLPVKLPQIRWVVSSVGAESHLHHRILGCGQPQLLACSHPGQGFVPQPHKWMGEPRPSASHQVFHCN